MRGAWCRGAYRPICTTRMIDMSLPVGLYSARNAIARRLAIPVDVGHGLAKAIALAELSRAPGSDSISHRTGAAAIARSIHKGASCWRA